MDRDWTTTIFSYWDNLTKENNLKWQRLHLRIIMDADWWDHLLSNKYRVTFISVHMRIKTFLQGWWSIRKSKHSMSAILFINFILVTFPTSKLSKSNILKLYWQNWTTTKNFMTWETLHIHTLHIITLTSYQQFIATIISNKQTHISTHTTTIHLRFITCQWYISIITLEDWQWMCYLKRMVLLCFW